MRGTPQPVGLYPTRRVYGDPFSAPLLLKVENVLAEPGACLGHGQTVKAFDADEVIEEPFRLGVNETAWCSLLGIAHRFKEEVSGAIVVIPFDLNRDDAQCFGPIEDRPEEVDVELLIGGFVFGTVDGNGSWPGRQQEVANRCAGTVSDAVGIAYLVSAKIIF